ncbi:MAG: hypothetical protein LBL86_00885 [Coriobacteriales bacterium]|jgi:hypothetical protein|nr:hypothetical protein [Coriobacteriales bacterium]
MKACPICGFKTLRVDEIHDICPVCMWEDDPIQVDDPDFWGGANSLSLNDYRAQWIAEHKRSVPEERTKVAV